MASLLIIGGSGFFGKSILDAYHRGLLNSWKINEIFIVARNASSLQKDCPWLVNASVSLINSDISSCVDLPETNFVIHAAASTDLKNYLNQAEIEKKNIQAGTYHYCDLAKERHRNSRIVYCSSGAIYGQQPAEIAHMPEEFNAGLVTEMALGKRDYAAAKRDGEVAIRMLGYSGLSVSIARCFAFVGPYLPRTLHFAIGNFIEDGLKGRSIKVKSQDEIYRSYMYADDLVVWLMTIAAAASPACPVFNVGSDQAIEVKDLAQKIGDQFDVPVFSMPIKQSLIVDRYVPSINKAKNSLNLHLDFSLDAAIDASIREILALK